MSIMGTTISRRVRARFTESRSRGRATHITTASTTSDNNNTPGKAAFLLRLQAPFLPAAWLQSLRKMAELSCEA